MIASNKVSAARRRGAAPKGLKALIFVFLEGHRRGRPPIACQRRLVISCALRSIKAPLTDSPGFGRIQRIRQNIARRVPKGQTINNK